MAERYKRVEAFAMPTEYERAAMEAKRRRRMAEMLAQQAYTPQDVGSAPIPRAAPLVQGLQAFLLARQLKKAEEAEGAARLADVKSAIEEMQRINKPPEAVEFGDIPSMRPEDQERVKALTGQASVTGPEFNISPTGEVTGFQPMQMGEVPDLQPYLPTMTADQKRLAYAQMLGGGPVSQLLGTQGLAKLDKSVEEEFGTTPVKGADGRYYLVSKAGRTIPTDIGIPEEEITPYQLAQLGMDQERLGLEQQRIELQRAGGPEPLHIVDVNGVPTYIPRSQAAGRPAFVSKTAAGPTGDDRADRRKHRDTRIQLQNAYDSIAEFAKELKNTPKEASLYGAAAGRLSSKYKLALGAVRVLQNTGVLNPGELPFIEDTLRDPQSLKQLFNPASRETITGQINAIADLLEQQSRTNDELYEYDVTPLKNRDWRSETIPARALAAGLTQADWDRATEEEKAAWR